MRSLVEQVRQAHSKSDLTVQQLLEKSGLPLERSTLQRKLSGDVPTTTDEIEALAKALDYTLVWPRRGRSA